MCVLLLALQEGPAPDVWLHLLMLCAAKLGGQPEALRSLAQQLAEPGSADSAPAVANAGATAAAVSTAARCGRAERPYHWAAGAAVGDACPAAGLAAAAVMCVVQGFACKAW
jgi:hypothetical protein